MKFQAREWEAVGSGCGANGHGGPVWPGRASMITPRLAQTCLSRAAALMSPLGKNADSHKHGVCASHVSPTAAYGNRWRIRPFVRERKHAINTLLFFRPT